MYRGVFLTTKDKTITGRLRKDERASLDVGIKNQLYFSFLKAKHAPRFWAEATQFAVGSHTDELLARCLLSLPGIHSLSQLQGK